MKHFIIGTSILLSMAAAGCQFKDAGPEITGPEPPPPLVKLLSRDSISVGNYRGIAVNSSTNHVFEVLEDYRQKGVVAYQGAINNFFSDVTDLKDRLQFFDYLVLDEKIDTSSGVQIQLEAGTVKGLTLNDRTELKQWPETTDSTEAIRIGDTYEALYKKLLTLSAQSKYAHKFEKMALLAKYTYALYDPAKASLPWSFTYSTQPDLSEHVEVHFKEKKVQYMIVTRFQKL